MNQPITRADLADAYRDARERARNMIPAAEEALAEHGPAKACAVIAKALHVQPGWTREELVFVLSATLIDLAEEQTQ